TPQKKAPEVEEKAEYVNLDSPDDESGSEDDVPFASWPTQSALLTTTLDASALMSTGLIPIGAASDDDEESSDDTPGNPLAQSRWVSMGEVKKVNLDDSDED